MRVAVCFACNEAYFPLCKGLVLSLKDMSRFFPLAWQVSLNFIDIGCSEASLAWLAEQNVAVHTFEREKFLPGIFPGQAPSYADAQLCRPFLPAVVQGHDVYVWADCDIWVQGQDVITVMGDTATHIAGKALICPEYHYGYIGQRNLRYAVMAHSRWYTALYDEKTAEELSFRPMFNTGFFAIESASLLWNKWGDEIARLYAVDRCGDASVLHFAEQLAFNYVIHRDQAFIPLDPLYNYACGGSAVFLNPQGKVLVGFPPFSPAKCVHLLDFPRYGRMYLEKKLLYRKGEYLSEAELAALGALVKQPA